MALGFIVSQGSSATILTPLVDLLNELDIPVPMPVYAVNADHPVYDITIKENGEVQIKIMAETELNALSFPHANKFNPPISPDKQALVKFSAMITYTPSAEDSNEPDSVTVNEVEQTLDIRNRESINLKV